MAEETSCPYCGLPANAGTAESDEKKTLRCSRCGGYFDYIPGFGAFSLSDEEQSEHRRSQRWSGYSGVPRTIEFSSESEGGPCIACCVIICILGVFFIPLIFILSLF